MVAVAEPTIAVPTVVVNPGPAAAASLALSRAAETGSSDLPGVPGVAVTCDRETADAARYAVSVGGEDVAGRVRARHAHALLAAAAAVFAA